MIFVIFLLIFVFVLFILNLFHLGEYVKKLFLNTLQIKENLFREWSRYIIWTLYTAYVSLYQQKVSGLKKEGQSVGANFSYYLNIHTCFVAIDGVIYFVTFTLYNLQTIYKMRNRFCMSRSACIINFKLCQTGAKKN